MCSSVLGPLMTSQKKLAQVPNGALQLPCQFCGSQPCYEEMKFFFFNWHLKAVQTITIWSFSLTRDGATSLPLHQLTKGKEKKNEGKNLVSCTASLLYLIDLFESVPELNLVWVAKFNNQLKFQFHAAFNIENFIVVGGGGWWQWAGMENVFRKRKQISCFMRWSL